MKVVHNIIHWLDVHSDSLVILGGATTGALWKINIMRVVNDLFTLGNVEGAIVVAIKAFIGAAVAWGFKTVCNHITGKNKRRRK